MRTILAMILGLTIGACGGDTEDPPGATTNGGAGNSGAAGSAGEGGAGTGGSAGSAGTAGGSTNQPPTWGEAPTGLAVPENGEVRVAFVPVDPDGDAVEATVEGGDGWSGQVVGAELVVRGRFDGASSSTMKVKLDDKKGGTAELSIAITTERMAWKTGLNLTTSGVEAREHPALILDEEGKRVLVLGGSGYKPYGTPLGDLHEVALDSGAVTARTPQGEAPDPAGSRRVARVPGERVAYLFGGYGAQGASTNDLFRVDFSQPDPVFTRLQQKAPPSARGLHLFAYDPETATFFVFGGVGFAPLSDLYAGKLEGDEMSWKKLQPASPKPSARYGFFYGVDQARGSVLVYSGAQGTSQVNPARDLWKLDLRTDPPSWSLLLEGEAVPEGRRNGAFAYDEQRSLFYIWGGTANAQTSAPGLWVHDGREGVNAWFNLEREDAPPIRSSGAAVVDTKGTVHLGFGNTTSAVYGDLHPFGYLQQGDKIGMPQATGG